MENLIKLDPVTLTSLKEVTKLYNTTEGNVQPLRSLGIKYEHFWPLLVSIIHYISRKLGRENWNIEYLLLAIKQETTTSDQCRIVTDRDTRREILKKRNMFQMFKAKTLSN